MTKDTAIPDARYPPNREALQHRGLTVTLVEILDQVTLPLDHEMARDKQYHVEAHNVTIHPGTAATGVREEDGQLIVELSNGRSHGYHTRHHYPCYTEKSHHRSACHLKPVRSTVPDGLHHYCELVGKRHE